MNERIKTLNSTYEVDWDGLRVRRVNGRNEPTPNQPADGEWQRAVALRVMGAGGGEVLYMFWDHDRATISSLITAREPL
jgi:hypothetical protein